MAQKAPRTTTNDGVYVVPFPPPRYREVRMVSDDGVLLVEIRIHERAQLTDPGPIFRTWHQRIREKEERERHGGLQLIIPDAGDVKSS